MFGFFYEISAGISRLAIVLHRAEDVSEIMIFLADTDAPIYDLDGRASKTPRLYVDSSTLPDVAAAPTEVLSGGDS